MNAHLGPSLPYTRLLRKVALDVVQAGSGPAWPLVKSLRGAHGGISATPMSDPDEVWLNVEQQLLSTLKVSNGLGGIRSAAPEPDASQPGAAGARMGQ